MAATAALQVSSASTSLGMMSILPSILLVISLPPDDVAAARMMRVVKVSSHQVVY